MNIDRRILVAQIGARMYYAVPLIFYKANLLTHFYTDLYLPNNKFNSYMVNILNKIFSFNFLKQLKNRTTSIPKDKITAFNYFGLIYRLHRIKTRKSKDRRWKIHLDYADRFNRLIIKSGFKNASIIYSHNTASLILFKKAKEMGIKCICEQVSAPKLTELKLLQEEQERWKGWELPIDSDLYSHYFEKEKKEWELSDIILAPSEFVFSEMLHLGVPKEKIRVTYYGISLPKNDNPDNKKELYNGSRPLRILFVGYVNLQKGVQYLLEAIKKLKSTRIEVKIIGGIDINSKVIKEYSPLVEFMGFIPRSEVINFYNWADIFVYPSICEGSATVVYEALSFGLPIITTFNTGSVIRHEMEGFIVPIRDSDSIAQTIEYMAMHPSIIDEMSISAKKIIQNFTIEEYGKRLVSIINEIS